jgi:hypothetical protein
MELHQLINFAVAALLISAVLIFLMRRAGRSMKGGSSVVRKP